MVRLCKFTHFFLLTSVAFFQIIDLKVTHATSQMDSFAGVFMFIEDGKYTLDFTAAKAACLDLNVTIATVTQMFQALQRGLETCKFGWTAEKIAVIPRQTPNPKCGTGETGVVTWNANPNRKFAVFCFNTSDFKETLDTATVSPLSSLSPSPSIRKTQTGTGNPTTPLMISTASPSNMKTTKSPKQAPPSSIFTQLQNTTGIIPRTATPSHQPSTINMSKNFSHVNSSKREVATFAFSTSVYSFASTEPVPPLAAEHSLGVLRTTLIALGVIALLLIVAGAIWRYRLMFFPCWSREQLNDDAETEMWKSTYSETDSQSQPGTEEQEDGEESYR